MFDKRLKCYKNAPNTNKTTEKLKLTKKIKEKIKKKLAIRRNQGEYFTASNEIEPIHTENIMFQKRKQIYEAIIITP